MKGKIALVTGVGRKQGIGAAICRELAKNGADVFFTYWHQYDVGSYPESEGENPASFAEELKQFGGRVASREVDLSRPENSAALFEAVIVEMGAPDILVNNAAVSTHQPFTEVTAELLDAHYAINVRAVTLLCQDFVRTWNKGEGGNILNLTSGQDISIMKDELPYVITKASVEMLTRQLAPELLEKGIRINALDPGPTDTGWINDELREQIMKDSKKGRINTPEDTAQLVVSLLLDESNKTGQVIHAEW